ncbi:hypothetical protein [Yoonia sp. 208BN28-4]|uniref:hypothetical protein n=1 Tax=Yoonia sp. 208BN28-4 TaxID=3126505 RepID=UPI0030B70011
MILSRSLRIAMVAALWPANAFAYEVASGAECRAMWQAFVDIVPIAFDDDDNPRDVPVTATDDGWCRISGAAPELQNAQFDTFDFRADGINRLIVDGLPPRAVGLRFSDFLTEGPEPRAVDTVNITLSHDQASRTLLLENFEMLAPDGNRLQLTAVFNHLDLSNRGTMMMSLGGISLSQMAGVMDVVGGDDLFEARRKPRADQEMFLQALPSLPESIADDDSKAALRAFLAADTPDGTLTFSLLSARGIGFLQSMTGSFVNRVDTPEGVARALELMLDGATVRFAWEPALTIEH